MLSRLLSELQQIELIHICQESLVYVFSRRKNDDLSEKLVKLVVPIAIQQFMLALVSATDAVMLGFVDQTSLSAASLAGQIQFVLNLFIAGITAGSGIMISQYWERRT